MARQGNTHNIISYHIINIMTILTVGFHVREGVVDVSVVGLVSHHALQCVYPLGVRRQLVVALLVIIITMACARFRK